MVLGDFKESVLASFASPPSKVPLGGCILSEYPENGSKPRESFGNPPLKFFVRPNEPSITGC